MTKFGDWEIDLRTSKVTASKDAYDIYGVNQNEVLKLSDIQKFPLKKYRKMLDEKLFDLIHHQKKYDVRFQIKKCDSEEIIWVHSIAFVKFDEDKKPFKVVGTIQDINDVVNAEKNLENANKWLETIIDATQIGIWDWNINSNKLKANQKLAEIYGYDLDEFPSDFYQRKKFIHPNDLMKVDAHLKEVFDKKIKRYSIEYRIKHQSGEWRWILDSGNVVVWSNNKPIQMIGISQDITEQKSQELKIKEVDRRYSQLVQLMPTGLAVHEMIFDSSGKPINYKFLSCNEAFEKQLGIHEADIIGKTVLDLFPDLEEYWLDMYGEAVMYHKTLTFMNYFKTLNKFFKVSVFPIENIKFATLTEDITEEKEKQDEIIYLSNHDYLTGLYNRHFFVKSFKKLDRIGNYPLAILMIDLNGLKIINDAFGHLSGDEALKIVAHACQETFQEQDIIARIGGDEFAVILSKTTEKEVEKYRKQLVDKISNKNVKSIYLSVATGFSFKYDHSNVDLNTLLKNSENHMYRRKLSEGISNRNNAIQAILNTLTKKYNSEKVHSKNVSQISYRIGQAMGLDDDMLQELKLAGLFHDIGKISIPDDILRKKGRLTNEEYDIIKNHTNTGYQILRAADKYSDLAIHALYHHERWDGRGYPKGLIGDEIPLLARIICVADAYDAMTSVRTYKDKMNEQDAIKEVIRCAGSQFDRNIAQVFVEDVMGYEWADDMSH
jgi:diguanylate cyclase (GGDEF)-like protein/PAS domain S-box-containing protein/putative nucleotidyltransferase with HDIG domain